MQLRPVPFEILMGMGEEWKVPPTISHIFFMLQILTLIQSFLCCKSSLLYNFMIFLQTIPIFFRPPPCTYFFIHFYWERALSLSAKMAQQQRWTVSIFVRNEASSTKCIHVSIIDYMLAQNKTYNPNLLVFGEWIYIYENVTYGPSHGRPKNVQ